MSEAENLPMALMVMASAVRLAVPLMFASLGGYTSERSGVVNIALEGMMLIGAFGAAAGAFAFQNPWVGLAIGVASGVALSAVHALLCINLKADPIISGIAINFVGAGLPPVAAQALYDFSGGTPQLEPAWCIPDFSFGSPLLLSAFAVSGLMVALHRNHKLGQYIRFAGEHPQALESQGVSVKQIRWIGVLLSGVFCGLAGAYLSIDHGTAFSRNMTAGRGFIALAALIVGRWTPQGAVLAALGFGAIEASQIMLQGMDLPIPIQWIQIVPYMATLLILSLNWTRKRKTIEST